MNELVQELLWWVFTRMIAPLLLIVILVQLWQNYQDKTPPPESTKSRQVKLDDRTLFTLNRLNEEGKKAYNIADYPTAQEKWEQGLNLARQAKNQQAIGLFIGNLGSVHLSLGNYPKALDYFQQALAMFKEVGDKRGEGKDLSNIGVVYRNLGDYPKALEYLKQALAIRQAIGDKRGIGNNLTNIGVVYDYLGDYPKALDYHQQALAIHKELGDKRGEGADLNNIGVVYDYLGDYPKALDYYQQALKIKKEIGDKRGIGDNLTNIGVVYRNLGDYPKALNYYRQALAIRQAIGDKRGEGADLNNIGVVYKNLGKYQKAKNAFQDSLVIKESIGADNTWTSQRGLASTEAKLNQPEPAIQHYGQAIDNIEKIRNFLAKEHKTSFMQDKLYVYDELIDFLQSLHPNQPKKGYDRKAFETFERKQGRLFLEEMGQSGARRFSGLDNEIIEAEQSLTLKLQKAQSLSPQKRTVLEEEEKRLKAYIKAKYPKYYALKYPQPVDLATLQNQVLQKGEMILVYGVISSSKKPEIESKTILWVISKQNFQMFTLPIDEDILKQQVAKLRGYLSDSSFHQKFPQASLDLYQTLLPKAARQLLADADILYIVPTGALYGLPFGSLVTLYDKARRKIQYFIEDYAISYLSSASLLKTLREEEHKTQPPEPLLAFADPDYPPCGVGDDKAGTLAQLRTKSYLKWTKGGCFNRLAATADEVREIANLFNADHSKALYLGTKASRSTVFALNEDNKLDDYRYVMFSVHGIIPDEASQKSKLLLERANLLSLEKRQLYSTELEKLEQLASVQPALALSNNSFLTMADAFTLKLNADFVNLSACNTGCAGESCGENVRGEGIMGLTRAFMYAGTPRVAVTLWSVNLSSAKYLSIGLFTHLKAKKKMAHALREIKLKMIQGKASNLKYMNPYHWAAFVVYGDGQ